VIGARPKRSGGRARRIGARPKRSGGRARRIGARPKRSGGRARQIGARPKRSGGRARQIGRRTLVLATLAVPGLIGQPAAAADDAASVNGAGIATDEFNELVTSLADAGVADFTPDPQSQTLGGENGRFLVTMLVTNEAARQFLDGAGEEPIGEDDIAAAIEQNNPALNDLPDGARETVGSYLALPARLDEIEPEVAALQEQYEASPTSLGAYCATAITDDDESSDWQCAQLSTVSDPLLRQELVEAAPGDEIGPVNTSDGLVTLVIDTWENAAPKLESFFRRLEDEGSVSAGAVLFQGFLADADITVDPRFGRWDATTGAVVALGS
jgi:hypothetical protein